MTLFARLTRWRDYLGVRLAIAEVDERDAEMRLKMIEAEALLTSSPKKGEVTVAKAERLLDPQVRAATDVHAEAHAYRKLIEVMTEGVERDAALLSRELTRRVGRQEINERRSDRWSR